MYRVVSLISTRNPSPLQEYSAENEASAVEILKIQSAWAGSDSYHLPRPVSDIRLYIGYQVLVATGWDLGAIKVPLLLASGLAHEL